MTTAAIVASIRVDVDASGASASADVRAVRRRWSKKLATQPGSLVLKAVTQLATSGSWTDRLVGFELLASHPAAFALLNDTIIELLADGLADWGSIDLFGVTVAGPAWREGLVSDSKIRAWVRSPDRWKRRLSLVATVGLNSRARGGSGDPRRTLVVCRLLMTDRDDMVVKAMSWALRELAKRNPDVVSRFLETEGDALAARVRREVTNKLQTGLKYPASTQRDGS